MVFNILTLFPDIFTGFFSESIIRRAVEAKIVHFNVINIRDYSQDKHKKVDDYPFGGGRGMLFAPDPVFRAIESISERGRVLYPSPKGALLKQPKVRDLARCRILTIICGHYEGIDNRIVENLVDEEVSIGDYILTGGELAAAVIVDSITRELDGSLGNEGSRLEESFDDSGLLEYEQYTRPAEYRGQSVPQVLLSGDHEEIRKWRIKRRLIKTLEKRPELLDEVTVPEDYKKILNEIIKRRGPNERNK
ncbi:MAG TPA: tRNA (guanosine(37)-N1)-methyltransferase TrmD [Spirochaetes bacterium]|nr:tRNA (guanosine(37)-N1)-methyltransferase TrmD [Spirochaetota bacterium]